MPSLTISLSLKSSLRSSTRGDSYGLLDFNPSLVFDFKNSYYRKGGEATTFSSAITHAATTNATMVDSDGLLKWRPHNLMTYSEDFTHSSWTKTSASISSNASTSPDGSLSADAIVPTAVNTNHFLASNGTGVTSGQNYSFSVFAKAGTQDWLRLAATSAFFVNPNHIWFNLASGTVGTASTGVTAAITDVGNGWYLCEWKAVASANGNPQFFIVSESGDGTFGYLGNGSEEAIFVWGAQLNHSDLGGMVNNPDASTGLESYVPTTSAVVYLSRRGHHIYNGSAWVNEGILHESEARTNLMTSSGDLADLSSWAAGGNTAGSVTTGSPFGTYQTLTVSVSDSVNSAQRYQIGKSIISGQTYVSSCLLKHSVGTFWAVVDVYDTGGGSKRAWFDLQNGVVGTKDASVLQSGMIDYGDGWWLCWASATVASNSGGLNVELTKGDGIRGRTFGDTMLIAGTQYEQGSTPSSYIPTTSATVTRAADLLTVPAASLPYNSTNMSIQMDGKMTYADNGLGQEVQLYRWQLDGGNYLDAHVGTSNQRTGQIAFQQRQATSGLDSVGGAQNAYSPNTNVPFNLAGRYGSTFINGAHEGTLLTANTTPTVLADLSATDLELGTTFMGTIGQFRVWDEDLTDAGITEAST